MREEGIIIIIYFAALPSENLLSLIYFHPTLLFATLIVHGRLVCCNTAVRWPEGLRLPFGPFLDAP